MNDWAIIAILIIVFLLAMFVLPQFMIARTIPKVIKVFREHHALNAKSAKFVDELGLQQKSLIDRMMRPRDYKPRALQFLMQMNVIQMTDDGKIYLDEAKLSMTRWSNV